jgi:hypothetical protein
MEGRMLWHSNRNEKEYMCIKVVLDPSGSGFGRSQWNEAVDASYRSNVLDKSLIYDPRYFPSKSQVSFGEHYQATQHDITAASIPRHFNTGQITEQTYQASDYQSQSDCEVDYEAGYQTDYQTDSQTDYQAGYQTDEHQHQTCAYDYPDQNLSYSGGGSYSSGSSFPKTGESSAEGALMATYGTPGAYHSQKVAPEAEKVVETEFGKIVIKRLSPNYDHKTLKALILDAAGSDKKDTTVLYRQTPSRDNPNALLKVFVVSKTVTQANKLLNELRRRHFESKPLAAELASEGLQVRDRNAPARPKISHHPDHREKGREMDRGRGKGKGKGKESRKETEAEPVVVDGTSKKAADTSSPKGKGKSHEYTLVDRTRRH